MNQWTNLSIRQEKIYKFGFLNFLTSTWRCWGTLYKQSTSSQLGCVCAKSLPFLGRELSPSPFILEPIPVSSGGSCGFTSCSSMSNAAISGGGSGSGGAAFTGVVDSGVSNASSESELLQTKKNRRRGVNTFSKSKGTNSPKWTTCKMQLSHEETRIHWHFRVAIKLQCAAWFLERNIMFVGFTLKKSWQ